MGITKIIPDTITSMNLACGVLGVIFTLNGRPDTGFLFMLGAAVADFFDGFVTVDELVEIAKEQKYDPLPKEGG